MRLEDEAKIAACPPPADLSAAEKEVWAALLLQVPLGSFGEAQRTMLRAYCSANSELEKLTGRKLTRTQLARFARLTRAMRQVSLQLNLRALIAQEGRSATAVIEEAADGFLTDPENLRAGLWGGRVVGNS